MNNTTADEPSRSLAETAPPMRRGSMVPRPWARSGAVLRHWLVLLFGPLLGMQPRSTLAAAPWARVAGNRRRLLLALVIGSAAGATWLLESVAPGSEHGFWAVLQSGLFALLFAWVAAGFVTALMGYFTLLRGDPHALTAASVAGRPIDPSARTAVIMPICNEDIATVAGGLRATCESLRIAMQRAGVPDVFDVFLLSDTGNPKLREEEIAAWEELRASLGGHGDRTEDGDAGAPGQPGLGIYYRWRQRRTKKKAGNVADFCRRWGRDYRYMVVLDADSVMSGEALLAMVRLMEAHPRSGIVQTAPRSCGHDSLHARVQQFSGRVSGALFSAGLRYWQLGESHYWGHNAILRVEPFMKHCGLAALAGKGGLSGAIMSHDFVEAALMRRAGYEVWLVPDIEGSFEQPPPHLIDELQRDRRWCQGNLQNARLVAEPGLSGVHRAMFVTGAMSYVASPLWLAFALLGVLPWVVGGTSLMMPGAEGQGADASWAAMALWTATLAMLFLPRVLAVALVLHRDEQDAYGGVRKLVTSAGLEALLSALQAPVRMLAHSIFVVGALTGLKLAWKSPSREASAIGWREALGHFGLIGVLVAGVMAWWLAGEPEGAWRMMPLALPLVLAVPMAVITSRTTLGHAWRRRGWLLIPEESQPPSVLTAAWRYARPASVEPLALPVPSTPQPLRLTGRGRGAAVAWPGRGMAVATFAVMAGGSAVLMPNSVATGFLSASDLAAMRIVMMASSPTAAPRVLNADRPAAAVRAGARRVMTGGSPNADSAPRVMRSLTRT